MTQSSQTPPGFPWLKSIASALAAGVALAAASYITAWALQTQAPFELLADEATRIIPASFFSKVLDALKYWGKPVLLIGLSLGWLAVGAGSALAAMYARWRSKAGGTSADLGLTFHPHPFDKLRTGSNPLPQERGTSPHPNLPHVMWGRKIFQRAGRGRAPTVVIGAALAAAPLIVGGLVISPLAGKGVFGWDLASGSPRFTLALLISGVVFAYTTSLFSLKPSGYVQNDSSAPIRKTLLRRGDFIKVTGFAALGVAGARSSPTGC